MEEREDMRDLAEATDPAPGVDQTLGDPPHEAEVVPPDESGEGEKYDGGEIPAASTTPAGDPDLDPQPEPVDPNQPSEFDTSN